MGWTAPRTWTVGEVVTKVIMDAHIKDNLRYLKGLDGAATFEDDLTVDNLITAGNVDGVDVSAHKAGTAKAQHTGGAGDHTHQSSGAEGAKIDHGAAIDATSLLDDDHTQYALRTIMTADGDIIYRASGVWTRLAKGTGLYALRMNAGATAPEWASIGATQEVYTPVVGFTGGNTAWLYSGITINGAGEEAYLQLLVPHNFTAITALEVIFNSHETGADMHFKFTTYFGAYDGGEAYNAGSETGDNRDIGATVANQNLAHDIADLTTGLAAGDLLLVKVEYNATAVDSNALVVGLRLKYS